MKRINKFNSFDKVFEAQNPLEQAYLDEVKRRAGEEGEQKIRNGEILPPEIFYRSLEEMQRIHSIEGNRERLEILAEDVIMEHFGDLLTGVSLNMSIVDKNSEEFQDMHQKMVRDEEESEERREEILDDGDEDEDEDGDDENQGVDIPAIEMPEEDLTDEVNKRKLINIFIQGSAKNLHRILHCETSTEGLNEIDPQLFDLMDKTIKTNEFMEWKAPEEAGPDVIQQGANGMNEISWEDEDEKDEEAAQNENENEDIEDIEDIDLSPGTPTINAIAIDYMILLHEAVKGIYGLIGQNGYAHLDPEKISNILAQTDTLADEFHDLKYGTYIRRDIVDFINKNPKINNIDNHIEYIFYKMVEYPTESFVEFIWGIIQGTEKSRHIIDGMIDEVLDEQEDILNQQRQWDAEKTFDTDDDIMDQHRDKPEMSDMSVDDILGGGSTSTNASTYDVEDSNTGEPQPLDYSKMSQIELKREMDAALDEEDWDAATEIQPFLESKKTKIQKFETFKRK